MEISNEITEAPILIYVDFGKVIEAAVMPIKA